ncbi:MAG: cytochrome-c peroxidase [Thiotrichales bacterium]
MRAAYPRARVAGQIALAIAAALTALGWAAVSGPGDFRDGYEHADFSTRSIALAARQGEPADLLALAEAPVLGLPPLEVPAANPLTREKIALGRKLFFDRRLSLNGTQSCAMCHVPEQGFAHNEIATAVGIEGRDVGRNAPTLFNVAYKRRLFHDARETSLEHQAWQPLINPLEMANPSIGWVLARLGEWPDYRGLFEAAFTGSGATLETVGQALASYQRTLRAGNSPFDRWYYGGDAEAVDEAVKRGFRLFTGKAGCAACHTVGVHDALFSDQGLHHTGIGYAAAGLAPDTPRRVLLAPGVFAELAPAIVASVSGAGGGNDLGRYEITRDPADRWKFLTPMLRNVALTAPYMHDGSLPDLPAVVAFYDRGGEPNPLLSPLIRPLGLTSGERDDLVRLLDSLTSDAVETLVRDAFAAPIGDLE